MDRSKWEYRKLGEVANCQIGLTYKPTDVVDDGGTIVLRSSNIQDNKIALDDIVRVNCNINPSKYVNDGDILMCSRNGSFRLVGKVAKIKNLAEPMSYGAFMTIIRSIYNDFLFYFFLSHSFRKQIFVGQTATINQITTKMLNNISMALPPIADQQRIVAELDCLNEMIALKQEQLKEFDKLAQSIFYDMFGDPITNEKGWNVVSWNEALQILNGRNQKLVENPDGQYPICGSAGVMGRANDYICPEDTVIIGRKGNINKPILMREKYWNVDTAFGLVPNREKLDCVYLFYFCDEYDFEKHNRAVTIPSLTKSDLLRITFPLPPLALQQQFAEKIQAIEAQKELVKKSIAETQHLLDSRMDYYFD